VAKAENIGAQMTIDDKMIGNDMFTIMTNQESGKIALLVETLKVDELKSAIKFLGTSTQEITSISCDMSASYLKLIKDSFPKSNAVIDKFHVIKHVIDAVQSIRIRLKNELMKSLPRGKKKTKEDGLIFSDIELIRRCKYLLSKSQDKWKNYQSEMMTSLFERYSELKTAYQLSEYFKHWYNKSNCINPRIVIEQQLFTWYHKIEKSGLEEFKSVLKMVEKHEENILNYFENAITNAKAENMNSKIQRFVINNYGLRDKDFALYRIAKYFS